MAHNFQNRNTNPIFIQADGKIPICAHDRRVNGLASRKGFVNETSSTLSESSNENQGINELTSIPLGSSFGVYISPGNTLLRIIDVVKVTRKVIPITRDRAAYVSSCGIDSWF